MKPRNTSHPRIADPNGSKNWRDWLPKPAPPTTVAGLQKKLADLSVQRVGVRERIAANRNHQTLEQYRTQVRRDSSLRKVATLFAAMPRRNSRGPNEAAVAARYGLTVSEWRRATRR
jgi:hypothetical protein